MVSRLDSNERNLGTGWAQICAEEFDLSPSPGQAWLLEVRSIYDLHTAYLLCT